MVTEHRALDVPRGTRIVAPPTVAGMPLAGATILGVKMGDGCVHYDLDDGTQVALPTWLRVKVENDTPQRRDRLAFAHAVLSGGGL